MSAEQFERIRGDYAELKHKLDQLSQNPVSHSDRVPSARPEMPMQHSMAPLPAHLASPVPTVDPTTGLISQGYSSKFNQNMYVTGRNGEDKGIESSMQDNAFLQLQLQECFELINRKDETLKQQKREIDTLYNRIKRYLLVQDHLYKDHVKMEREHEKAVEELKTSAKLAEESFALE